jgi:predicted Zn-dependent peptidase
MAELAVLDNGLRVVLVPCEAQSVAFGLFVASGSRHETDEVAGISHFIEHMLFKGTKKRSPVEITRAIEGRGGNFNAWTSEESTAYFTHMPFEYLDEAVDIISDMYLNAKIADDDFRRERDVILEEIKMYADEPDAVAMENLQRALFPRHRLGAPIAGSAASLMPLKPRDMKDYIASHYRADNTIAVIAGRFGCDKALKAVEKRLSCLPGAVKKVGARKQPRFQKPVSEITVSKDVQQTQLALGYRTFGIADGRKYAASVFDAVMGRGMSSRLFQEVREKRGLSYDISSRMQFFSDAGIWSVTAGVDPAKAGRALEVIDRELRRICDRKVGAAELKRTKEFLTGNFRISHERVQAKLFFYAQTMLSYGKLVMPEEQVEGIRSVTAADVQAVAVEILDPSRRSLSTVVPR